jgi:hypothetical protein
MPATHGLSVMPQPGMMPTGDDVQITCCCWQTSSQDIVEPSTTSKNFKTLQKCHQAASQGLADPTTAVANSGVTRALVDQKAVRNSSVARALVDQKAVRNSSVTRALVDQKGSTSNLAL